nr:hydroxyphenylacetyl-CoA thioesterase PaaI [Nakamurella aerolata]
MATTPDRAAGPGTGARSAGPGTASSVVGSSATESATSGSATTGSSVIGSSDVTGAAAMMAADQASAAAGVRVVELSDGHAVATMTVRGDMTNGHQITHGGYVFLLADTAFACACNASGSVTVAAGADITFLSATRAGDVLTATADRRSERGRSGVYDVTVTDGAGAVVAEFRGRSRRLDARGGRG